MRKRWFWEFGVLLAIIVGVWNTIIYAEIVCHLKFDEGEGQILEDVSGKGNGAILGLNKDREPGIEPSFDANVTSSPDSKYSLYFPGGLAKVVSLKNTFASFSEVRVDVWCKKEMSILPGGVVWSKYGDMGNRIIVAFDGSGSIYLELRHKGGIAGHSGITKVNDTNWHRITTIVSPKGYKVYLDDTLEIDAPDLTARWSEIPDSAFVLGNDYDAGRPHDGSAWRGWMDEFKVESGPLKYDASLKVKESEVLMVYSRGEYAGFTPVAEFDDDFKNLGWFVKKCPLSEITQASLGKYNLVIFSSMILRKAELNSNWKNPDGSRIDKYGSFLKKYLEGGGMILLTDIVEDSDEYNLTHISHELKLNVEHCLSGLVDKFLDTPLTNHPYFLPDHEVVYNPFQICRRIGGTYAWVHFINTPKEWQKLAICPDKHPVLLGRNFGQGFLAVTTLSAGGGIDAYFLENLLFYSKKRKGNPVSPGEVNLTLPTKQIVRQNLKSFDNEGNILVDGKPFFPLGFYGVRKESYPILAANGFNCVWGGDPEEIQKSDTGLRLISGASWDMEETRKAAFRSQNNPAVIAQYLGEEPGNLPVPPFYSSYFHSLNKVIKDIVPECPTTVLVNNPIEFPAFGLIGDFASCDPYCFSRIDSPAVGPGSNIDLLRQLAGNKNLPVWVILQTHWFGTEKETWLIKPTIDQIIAETYVSLVHRANGIFYFTFDDDGTESITFIRKKDGSFDEPLWDTLKQIAREIEILRSPLLSPLPPQSVVVDSPKNEVEYLLRSDDRKYYILLVNPMSYSVKAEIKWISKNQTPSKVESLFSSAFISIEKGKLMTSLKPYQREVFIYGNNTGYIP